MAAANSTSADKSAADFVCSGTNDEAVLTKAIGTLTRGGTLKLADGDYYIDAFPYEGSTAVFFGYNDGVARTINVVGGTENKSYNTRFGVGIHVTKAAMSAMDDKGTYRVFCGTRMKPKAPGAFYTYTFVNNANFRDIYILFDDASKPVRGIEFRTVNLDHSMTSRSEHPEYLETYFDKKTNKTFTWNGKMWVDAMGNPAD